MKEKSRIKSLRLTTWRGRPSSSARKQSAPVMKRSTLEEAVENIKDVIALRLQAELRKFL
jgi:hypothetical protein